MRDNYLEKVKAITTCFNIYGYGNFDLTLEEFAHLLALADKNDPKDLIIDFYERLKEQRLG